MRITYIGHATCLLEIAGRKILTDPVWAKWIFFIKRLRPPGLRLEQVLPVDLVLLSHAHFDHLDMGTISRLDRRTPIICAKNMARLFKSRGFREVYELDWWQAVEILGLKVTSVPAKHFGGRWQFWDRFLGYCGFVIGSGQKQEENIYFAGDTGFGDFFSLLSEMFQIQAVLLPIGAYTGPGSMDFHSVHMNPHDAISAFKLLKAKYLVPMHFGTYRLSVEPISEPEEWLKEISLKQRLNGQIKILNPGESFNIDN